MSNFRGTWTLFKRETMRFMKVYMQTLLAPVVSNLLYFAIFGISLHRSIPEIDGVSYLAFLVPGLIILGVVNNAYQNPSTSILIMKYQGLLGDMMSIPLKRFELLMAFTCSAVLRAMIIATMTYLTSLFFVDFNYTSISIIIISSLLVSFFFSFFGLIVGIWAEDFDKMAFVQNFLLMPLIFLGGVFYPVSSLPATFAGLSSLNPLVYMINLIRYGFTGILEFPLITSFMVTGIGTFLLGLFAYLLLRSGYKLQN